MSRAVDNYKADYMKDVDMKELYKEVEDPWNISKYKGHYDEIVLGPAKRYIDEAKAIADIGCGIGMLISSIDGNFTSKYLYGYDISPVAIDKLYKRISETGSNLRYGVVLNISEESILERFDLAFVIDALYYSTNPKFARKNVYDCVRPGGTLIIADGLKNPYYRYIFQKEYHMVKVDQFSLPCPGGVDESVKRVRKFVVLKKG